MNKKINKKLTDKQIKEIAKKSKHLGAFFDDFLKEELAKDKELKILYEKERFLNQISNTFSLLRKKKNLTQKQIADEIGSTVSVVSRFESLKNTRVPTLDFLYKMAKAFDKEIVINLVDTKNIQSSRI